MTWQALILRLIEILRPRFYHRITWLVVFGGLAMMSTQLWELVASEILKRELNISVSGSNDTAWGFALCVLGLAYHMANTGFYDLLKNNEVRTRKEQERSHDIEIFRTASQILSDQQIEDFVDVLQRDHAYRMEKSSQIDEFARYLTSSSNHFLTPSVSKATERFLTAWSAAGSFLNYNFFVFPNNQTEPPFRLCMTPCLNMDLEGNGSHEQVQKYDNLTAELEQLTDKLIADYRALRSEIKSALVI